MNTPIYDFVSRYMDSGAARLHVPGHKGVGPLGCEGRDITEVAGADALYEADGIIAESERNASALFGTGATFYSAEGSSLCIRAMLYLALTNRASDMRPVVLAARNAHKAFLYAAALCDFDVQWLWPDEPSPLCACPVSPGALAKALDGMKERPFCVYVTSPDYLGGMQDIRGLAAVCHGRGIPLIVDNAHGAYLKFLKGSGHPMDLGADMCCDSAHKTLPALTGGAYLHLSKDAHPGLLSEAKAALSLFGSTSPSYLILQSLDLCNAALAGDFPPRLAEAAERVEKLKRTLADRGLEVLPGEPMKLTLRGDGRAMAERLRAHGAECEYADGEHAVLMFAPDNSPEDYDRVARALKTPMPRRETAAPPLPRLARAMSIREAVFAPSEVVETGCALGRVCAAPTVACPPAIPIAVSGEIITREAVEALEHYGITNVRTVFRKGM